MPAAHPGSLRFDHNNNERRALDQDVSIELSRALRITETTAELLGDLNGLAVCEIETRERACALL